MWEDLKGLKEKWWNYAKGRREFYSSFNSFFAELDSVAKRHYLQTDEPSQFAKSAETERIYAQVGTLETRQLPNNQMFFQNQLDTMGKIPRKF